MHFIFTAVLEPKESGLGYFARIPDLPGCISSGANLTEALENITDAMSLWIITQEDLNQPIPAATEQHLIEHAPDSICTLVQCDTIQYRAETDTKAVRKNVSLPAWMATLADRAGINCSQILQEALKTRLKAIY